MPRAHLRPIPRRIPPLRWRRPVFLWTPLALALALGVPAWALGQEGGLAQAALVVGALVFACALVSLGFAWSLGRPPRTWREAMLHLLTPGVIAILAAPFVYETLLHVIAAAESDRPLPQPGALPLSALVATAPVALVIGLPAVLVSGLIFIVAALEKDNSVVEPRRRYDAERGPSLDARARDVQPFA